MSKIKKIFTHRLFNLVLASFLLFLIYCTIFPKASISMLSILLKMTPETIFVSLGFTILLISGELDLSVEGVFAFAPILMLSLWKIIHFSEAAFILTLGICCLIGFMNGFIVTRFKVPSMIVTLGVLFFLQGLSWVFGRTPEEIPFAKSGFAQWIASSDSYLPQLLWALFFVVIFWILLNRTRFGNWVLFTGGNERAAIDCGINTNRVKTICFILCSLMAALGGITAGIRIGGTSPLLGLGLVLEVIVIVVLGGTLLSGGKGSILGTTMTTFIVRLIFLGTVFLRLSSTIYMFVLGGFLIIFCILHPISRSKAYINFIS